MRAGGRGERKLQEEAHPPASSPPVFYPPARVGYFEAMWVADSSCLCGGSFSLPLWGVVRRFAGWFSCGWCRGCGLRVSWRLWASGGVWWRFVWRLVGRLGCRRLVVRVVGRGVLVSSCRRAGRGAARVSPCVSCRVAVSEAWWLFHVEEGGGACFLGFCVLSPRPRGRGAESFLQVVGVFCFKMWGVFSRFSFVFYMVFDIKKPPGAVFSSGVFFIWVRWRLSQPLCVDCGGDVVGCLVG